ncbi:MAG: hypothetical protein J5857_03040 [Treponema sp.]|nr:hypothetical protein [Treponema sp.]
MKEIIYRYFRKFILLTVLCLCPTFLFATIGIGVQGGWNFTNAEPCSDASLTLKFSKTPFTFTFDTGLKEDYLSLGLTVDYWSLNPKLNGMFRLYFGPGSTIYFANILGDTFDFYIGLRFVTGINVFVWTPIEVYVQTAAEMGYSTLHKFTWRIPVSLGTRVWF